jgi:hypothetical protein
VKGILLGPPFWLGLKPPRGDQVHWRPVPVLARTVRGRKWLTGVTLVQMLRICGDLAPDPWWTVSRVCVPGDLNPYVSDGRVHLNPNAC